MERDKDATKPLCVTFILLALILALLSLSGCTRTIYLPTENVREDSVSAKMAQYESRLQNIVTELKNTTTVRDSVHRADSVVYVVDTAGKVVSKEIWHDRVYTHDSSSDTEHLLAVIDSLRSDYESRIDTLSKEKTEQAVPVEKSKSKWERLTGTIGIMAIGMIAALIMIALIKLFGKLKVGKKIL